MGFLQVMEEQVKQEKLNDLLASPVFSIMIDETTDIAVNDGSFIDSDAHVRTVFFKIVELTNGCAETIESDDLL